MKTKAETLFLYFNVNLALLNISIGREIAR
jgi:glutamate formiminotransferase